MDEERTRIALELKDRKICIRLHLNMENYTQ